MKPVHTSNLFTALANAGQLNRTNNEASIFSDRVRDGNIQRFNTVIGQIMQEKNEAKQAEAETYVPKTFYMKEAYEETEPKPVEVKTNAEKLIEENNLPKPLHSGHLYDQHDEKGKPSRSISISFDLIKIVVIIIVGLVLISMYTKLNSVVRELEINYMKF